MDVCLIVCFEMVLNELGLTCSYHLNMIYFVEIGEILGKKSWIRGQGSGIVVWWESFLYDDFLCFCNGEERWVMLL